MLQKIISLCLKPITFCGWITKIIFLFFFSFSPKHTSMTVSGEICSSDCWKMDFTGIVFHKAHQKFLIDHTEVIFGYRTTTITIYPQLCETHGIFNKKSWKKKKFFNSCIHPKHIWIIKQTKTFQFDSMNFLPENKYFDIEIKRNEIRFYWKRHQFCGYFLRIEFKKTKIEK